MSGELTPKQRRAIPKILAAPNVKQGCLEARIAKTTFYAWLQDETFQQEFDRQAGELASTAFTVVRQNVEKAAETLAQLLDNADDRIRRLAANDVLEHYVSQKQLIEHEQRIVALEAAARQRQDPASRYANWTDDELEREFQRLKKSTLAEFSVDELRQALQDRVSSSDGDGANDD